MIVQLQMNFTEAKPETNCERVLRLLEAAGDIGVHSQHPELGKGFRLASRVWDLGQKGYVIDGDDRHHGLAVYRLMIYPDGRFGPVSKETLDAYFKKILAGTVPSV